MKKNILQLGVFLIFCCTTPSYSQWTPIGPNAAPSGTPGITSLFISGDTLWSSNNVFGAHYSTDFGQVWCETGMTSGDIRGIAKTGSIVVTASTANIMYSSNSGMDFGGTAQLNTMLDLDMGTSLAIVGSISGIYTSTNLGYGWTRPITSGRFSSVAISGNVMFAGDSTKVLRSTNNGASFVTSLSSRVVTSITAIGSNVYVCSGSGIDYTTDNGVTWNTMTTEFGFHKITKKGSDFYATSGSNIYKSTNNGVNWSVTYAGNITATEIVSDNNNIYALVNSQFYRSSNNGANWINYPYHFMQAYTAYKTPTSLLTSTNTPGIHRSTNEGANWTMHFGNVTNVRCFSTRGSTIYAGNSPYDGGVALTTNDGINWTGGGLSGYAVYSIVAETPNIVVSTYQHDIWFKENPASSNWWQANINAGFSIYALAGKDSVILAGIPTSGVYRSNNAGVSFGRVLIYSQSIGSIVMSGNYAFAGTSTGIFVSTDKGVTWASTSFAFTNVNALAISGNYVFAGTEKHGIFISQDLGSTWRNINGNLGKRISVNKLFISGNDLYAATYTSSVLKASISGLVGVTEPPVTSLPAEYSLGQNYPNPFNPVTTFSYDIKTSGFITLKVYDILGNEIAELVNENKNAGRYSVIFDAGKYNLSSGTYFYKLITGEFVDTKRMMLIK
ncbi:MAG: T9SS type A sorting domain-containing protein [Ignavibacteria bacterium]|nr:T9SS type A sorting domain-containing protein [Ignavibacteria bacterium]